MNTIAIIPARGGSKGVPRKNIKLLAGKPLVVYSIEVAQRSSFIDDVVVTTDDDEISEVGKQYGAQIVKRPYELAADDSLVMDAVRHVISDQNEKGLKYELLVLLEPTSPFRTAEDINQTIELLRENNADSAATFSETKIPPTRVWTIENDSPKPFIPGSDPFLPRQQQETGYALNGLLYVLKTEMLEKYPHATSFLLGKPVAHIVSNERVVDIDGEEDFLFAEYLLNTNLIKIN